MSIIYHGAHKEVSMDTQAWWEELLAQIESRNPNRDSVIECLHRLLERLKDGEPLPQMPTEE